VAVNAVAVAVVIADETLAGACLLLQLLDTCTRRASQQARHHE
jgi:hypothetical protein